MAHESFEDDETARQMNANFVNIKIDREERPDLDNIYQSALALLGGHGGWPLTMFLTPQGQPFWGGTYFPKTAAYGQSSFSDVLTAIARLYSKEPEKVSANVDALNEGIGRINEPPLPAELTDNHLEQIATHLLPHVDMVNGGLNGAPKFPYTSFFELLWAVYLNSGETKFADAVISTLTGLCQGGIYDHLGGGFSRYSVDEEWLAPHFEKMLYDNASLIGLMSEVWRKTKDPLLEQRTHETIAWLEDEMITEIGAFAASLDADSEGEEGKFYVWSDQEVRDLLRQDYDAFSKAYDVSAGGNWEGKTILNRLLTPDWGGSDQEGHLKSLGKRLKTARNGRIQPGWDNKVLTDWNGLMIMNLVEAALAFDHKDWLKTAENAFKAVCKVAEPSPGHLTHSYRDGRAHIAGLADDYAAMAGAALALYEATGKRNYLTRVEAWVATLYAEFRHEESGAFFLTSIDARDVIVRPFTANDAPIPSANGILTTIFSKLYLLTGKEEYRQQADQIVSTFVTKVGDNALGHATLLTAAEFAQKALHITLIGSRDDPELASMLQAIFRAPIPHRLVSVIDDPDDLPKSHPAADKQAVDGRPTVYVCQGQTCAAPITDLKVLKSTLTWPSKH